MHSFLIASKNKDFLMKKTKEICDEKQIDKFDISLLESEKQIGIADVKNIQAKAYLRPIKSKEKAIIILGFLGITTEAQNALLKLLEEPPNNTIILLLVETVDSVLPTIRSRCKIIELHKKTDDEHENFEEYLKLLRAIEKAGVGERLKFAQDYSKDKNQVIQTVEKMVLSLRNELLKNPNTELTKQIKTLQKTYFAIKNTNVNLRLALENLLLNL
jgi:DNA polymerase III delta prime subunit